MARKHKFVGGDWCRVKSDPELMRKMFDDRDGDYADRNIGLDMFVRVDFVHSHPICPVICYYCDSDYFNYPAESLEFLFHEDCDESI